MASFDLNRFIGYRALLLSDPRNRGVVKRVQASPFGEQLGIIWTEGPATSGVLTWVGANKVALSAPEDEAKA